MKSGTSRGHGSLAEDRFGISARKSRDVNTRDQQHGLVQIGPRLLRCLSRPVGLQAGLVAAKRKWSLWDPGATA